MACIIFHGPNDSNECRKVVTKLAKQLGGEFHYNSFWNGRRNSWFSDDTVGKAAYCIRLPLNTATFNYDENGENWGPRKITADRKQVAQIVKQYRKTELAAGLKFSHRI